MKQVRLPVWVKRVILTVCRSLPVFPNKRIFSEFVGHVSKMPSRDSCIATIIYLFNHLVGAAKERLRNSEAERLCGFQVNEQLDFGGLLHR